MTMGAHLADLRRDLRLADARLVVNHTLVDLLGVQRRSHLKRRMVVVLVGQLQELAKRG
jgi:hypothetical protein